VPTNTFSTSTFTSTSSVGATAPVGTQTSLIGSLTSTSKAAGETLVAGLGVLVGVAMGVVAAL
jgi:hypothetical protein